MWKGDSWYWDMVWFPHLEWGEASTIHRHETVNVTGIREQLVQNRGYGLPCGAKCPGTLKNCQTHLFVKQLFPNADY